jgi:hypothetical protein
MLDARQLCGSSIDVALHVSSKIVHRVKAAPRGDNFTQNRSQR